MMGCSKSINGNDIKTKVSYIDLNIKEWKIRLWTAAYKSLFKLEKFYKTRVDLDNETKIQIFTTEWSTNYI